MHAPSTEAPEVKEAMAKVEEYAALAATAKSRKDRDHYEKMRRKWLGLAEGWRLIAEIGGS
jgi:hypothetical protein